MALCIAEKANTILFEFAEWFGTGAGMRVSPAGFFYGFGVSQDGCERWSRYYNLNQSVIFTG
jgi:hypothetical protein